MKHFILTIFITLYLYSISAYAGDTNIVHTTSVAGANFKPYSGTAVTESNGCFSGVGYSNLKLPIGSVLIGAKITAKDTIGLGDLTIRIEKNYGPNRADLLIGNIDLLPLEISQYIASIQPYTINEDDFYALRISTSSDTLKICGVKVYTVDASEIIFFNGFE